MRGGVEAFKQGDCIGPMTGILDTAVRFDAFCAPRGVTMGQVLRSVVQFIDARPVRVHERSTWLALEALTATWPFEK
jgi:hypothetical protein